MFARFYYYLLTKVGDDNTIANMGTLLVMMMALVIFTAMVIAVLEWR